MKLNELCEGDVISFPSRKQQDGEETSVRDEIDAVINRGKEVGEHRPNLEKSKKRYVLTPDDTGKMWFYRTTLGSSGYTVPSKQHVRLPTYPDDKVIVEVIPWSDLVTDTNKDLYDESSLPVKIISGFDAPAQRLDKRYQYNVVKARGAFKQVGRVNNQTVTHHTFVVPAEFLSPLIQ